MMNHPPTESRSGELERPPGESPDSARNASGRVLRGHAVSPGICIGNVYVYDPVRSVVSRHLVKSGEVGGEIESLRDAMIHARGELTDLREKVRRTLDEKHAAIFDFQLMLLEDPELVSQTGERIQTQRENAGMAFTKVIHTFADQFGEVASGDLLKTRRADIIDVGNRVCQYLASCAGGARRENQRPLQFTEDVIVFAADLSPSDTAQMDHNHVMGFATELGGPTSHTAILARALEIPAVVGLGRFIDRTETGAAAILNGNDGTVTLSPTARERARARKQRQSHLARDRELKKLRDLPAETIDGYRVQLAANVELPIEIPHVLAHGAEGVGLFRTEFQYLERRTLPSEDELLATYRDVLERVAPEPVIFRTLDLGGDKFFSEPHTGRELNPFLGLRAIRLCLAYPDVFRVQLRAMLRASAHGAARIMFPMISRLREVLEAKQMLEAIKDELRAEGLAFDEDVPVGIMIEIPSAAVCADQLAREVDFFSIGTNDLIQYTMAVDRGNEQVASLYEPFHPAILRLLRTTIEAAQREGIWIGLCGEMSSNPLCALVLIGLGVDELSMSPLAIPEIKRLIRSIRLEDSRRIVEQIYSLRSASEIHETIEHAYRLIKRRRGKVHIAAAKAEYGAAAVDDI